MNNLVYVTDDFLDEFKTNFNDKYLPLYENNNRTEIEKLFSNPNNIIESSTLFQYKPLVLESENPDSAKQNIRIIWESLSHLSISEAENEKLWVALENTYYLDYHLDQLSLITGKNRKSSIESRTIFTRGKKRSLVINNLSVLWWIAYYTYDEKNPNNPFFYSDYFVDGTYRGNAVGYFSSNIVSNKEITLGTLEAIKELVENNKMIENRYAYTNSNKILNQIGGVRVLDTLSRSEVKKIIINNLLDTDKIRIPS